jgi:hypothetical protein
MDCASTLVPHEVHLDWSSSSSSSRAASASSAVGYIGPAKINMRGAFAGFALVHCTRLAVSGLRRWSSGP